MDSSLHGFLLNTICLFEFIINKMQDQLDLIYDLDESITNKYNELFFQQSSQYYPALNLLSQTLEKQRMHPQSQSSVEESLISNKITDTPYQSCQDSSDSNFLSETQNEWMGVESKRQIEGQFFLNQSSTRIDEFRVDKAVKTKSIRKENKKKNVEHRQKNLRGNKQKPYPTKNFLQNNKAAVFEELEEKCPVGVLQEYKDLLSQIKNKNGINLIDYQTLFRVEQFSGIFESMFDGKVLYRKLMISRCSRKMKKVMQKKIVVLEKGFQEKTLTKIN